MKKHAAMAHLKQAWLRTANTQADICRPLWSSLLGCGVKTGMYNFIQIGYLKNASFSI